MWKTAIGDGSEDVLEDLRVLYLRAQENAATWVMVSQAAKRPAIRNCWLLLRSAIPRRRCKQSGS